MVPSLSLVCRGVLLLVLALYSIFIGYLLYDVDLFKVLAPQANFQCRATATEEVIGPEDITIYKEGVLLATSDDRLRLWENPRFGPSGTPNGGIFAIYYDIGGAEQLTVEPVELVDFPSTTVAFHPHGLYLHRSSSRLYVINHAYNKGGERIDVFRVANNKEKKVTATYESSITSLLLSVEAMGALNDLVVIGGEDPKDHEVYVTQYRAFPDGVDGRHAPSIFATVNERINLLYMVAQRRWTRIIYCKGSVCRPAEGGGGGRSYNGISLSPDGKRLVVSDWKSAAVFDIVGEGKLKKRQVVKSAHVLDNIEPVTVGRSDDDATKGEESYTVGVIASVHSAFRQNNDFYWQTSGERLPTAVPVAGGMQVLRRDPETGGYRLGDVIITDGVDYSLTSCAVKLSGGTSPTSSTYLMGSWAVGGVYVCKGNDYSPSDGARGQQGEL